MKIELKISNETTMIFSDDAMNNDNYIEMWFENYRMDENGDYTIKDTDYPDIEPLLVNTKDMLKALSAFYEYKETE